MKEMTKLTLMAVPAAIAAMLLASPDADAAPIQEDDPGWNCVTMGDNVCGPGNSNGVTPGYYINGELFQTWPVVKQCTRIAGQMSCKDLPVDPRKVKLIPLGDGLTW